MKTKLTGKELIAVASMLFGMFFGAGNLIFPVRMGQLAAGNSLQAAAGFILTGVGLPLMGVAAMGISGSEGLRDMAERVGKRYAVFLTCLLYMTIGPFFAIPRCATTAFAVGIEPMVSGGNGRILLFAFSAAFFAAVLFFSLRPSGILTWIGKIINPVFLFFLAVLLAVSFVFPMGKITAGIPGETYSEGAFFSGFLEGYNTMDALASLAFGIIVINVIRELGIREPEATAANTVRAGALSCAAMAVIYLMITLMGAFSRGIMPVSENGGAALSEIAKHYFGNAGQLFLAATVLLACLKTAIGLVTSCARTFEEMFPVQSYRKWTVKFCVFPFLLANAGLNAIIEWSVPVLMFIYPLAITLILLSLFGRYFNYDRRVYVSVTVMTLGAAVFDFVGALPAGVKELPPIEALTGAASAVLPLYDIGLGWAVPAIRGLIVGLVIKKLGDFLKTGSKKR